MLVVPSNRFGDIGDRGGLYKSLDSVLNTGFKLETIVETLSCLL